MKKLIIAIPALFIMAACGNGKVQETPVDTTNVSGRAPVEYKARNPADDTLPITNYGDTGTKANNVHNAGTR